MAIRWDDARGWYEVVDGNLFESRFNALRLRRGKRKDDATDRPFARMHIHFVLVRGDKWAGAGSCFRSKFDNYRPSWWTPQGPSSQSSAMSNEQIVQCSGTETTPPIADRPGDRLDGAQVSADQVTIHLRSGGDGEGFRCTLQHFLDITGAGDIFSRAAASRRSATVAAPSNNVWGTGWAASVDSDETSNVISSSGSTTDCTSPEDSIFDDLPPLSAAAAAAFGGFTPTAATSIGEREVAGLVSGMWNESSLGDQAYFFPRRKGCAPFSNGSVVTLEDGVLGPDQCGSAPGRLFMVVSDNNAKWKGEPLPTPEEEKLGHWCAFLGQVPVRAACEVHFGDYLGPVGDGSGRVCVVQLGRDPVVGLALSATAPGGVVKALCFAGFNALAPLGEGFKEVFERSLRLERVVEVLAANVGDTRARVDEVRVVLAQQARATADLEARIEVGQGVGLRVGVGFAIF
mmetsp:Transcript_88654/g.235987  ORF Transcript_88654/g.235987 Transcript_88654/m.235987 type:complete len:459 (+) Transcript_88654:826-2202(+)